MIPRKHLTTVALINRDRVLRARILFYFGLRRGTLAPRLREAGLGQADLVLCLLRLGNIRYVEMLIGHPIKYGPTFRISHSTTGKFVVRKDATPRVTFVTDENPRLARTRAYDRFQEFRVGRTEEQLRARGVTRRDIRKAVRRGWIKMEEPHHV